MSSPPAESDTPSWLRGAVKAGASHHVRHSRPWAHNLANVSLFLLVVGVLVGLLALGPHLAPWAHVLVGGPLFGLGCYTLIAFVVHEASHDLFIVAADKGRERTLNRTFGWICSIPFGIHYLHHWEEGHRIHHLRPLEPDDPQRFNVATGGAMVRVVLAMVLIPFYAHLYRLFGPRPAGRSRTSGAVLAAFFAFWLVVGAAASEAWGWSALVVILWGQQWINVFNQVKGALEHGGPVGSDPELLLRSRSTLAPGARLFALYNATVYHFEHHLHPKVPWYALPAYHREIVALVPADARPGLFNRRVLDQLRGRIGRSGAAAE